MLVSLLEKNDHLCISKLMLKSFPSMIKNDSDFVLNYFNKSMFKPVLLQEPIDVLWPQDQEDFIFTSRTSLITRSTIESALQEDGSLEI